MTIQTITKPALDASAVYLGRYAHPGYAASGMPLSYRGERHHILIGPNGSGKGTRILVPNLLNIQDRSLVVFDTKGELTAITADFRRRVSDVIILNPFGVLGIPGVGFNPLASLDPNSLTFFDDCCGVGEALIKIEEKDPHWSESAQALVVSFLMWEVLLAARVRRPPSLARVRAMLTEPDVYEDDEHGKSKLVRGLRITARRMAAEGTSKIKSLIGRFTRGSDEINSIQSTADRQTTWTLSTPMEKNLVRDDIDFTQLKKRPTTVYVILPPERIRTHSVWLRLLLVTALRAHYTPGGLRTIFMLDEFAHLGHLAPVEDALALVRGYRIQLMPILQDLNQLKAIYSERWQSFLGSSGVVQGFAPNDLQTADWMSKRAGETTVVAAGYNLGNSDSENRHSANTGMSYQQMKRPLLSPNDLMGMGRGAGVIFLDGTSRTIPFFAPPYWDIPELAERAQANPYYSG